MTLRAKALCPGCKIRLLDPDSNPVCTCCDVPDSPAYRRRFDMVIMATLALLVFGIFSGAILWIVTHR